MNIKAYFAEFIGTFTLALIGCGVAVLTGDLIIIGLAFGLSVMAMAYAVGPISGGHFNPAVSFAMSISKKLKWKDFGMYTLFQLLGAGVATALLMLFFGSNANLASNQVLTTFGNQSYEMQLLLAMLVETVVTFLFVFVIISVTRKENNNAGLIIGLTLAVLIYFSGPMTNAGLNPARSILPALFEGGNALEQVWIFILGPLLGGALAAYIAPKFVTE